MVSILTLVGALAFSGGIMGYFVFQPGLEYGIKSAINLAENGLVYPQYMNPPFAAKSKFYLFAIKNPRDVLRGNKMEFQIKGPYIYKTMLERENIKFGAQQERLKFDSRRRLYPDESPSANFDERMWLLNPIVPTLHKSIRAMVVDRIPLQSLSEPIVFNSVNLLLDNYKERLIWRTTPRAFLNGKPLELIEAITNLAERFGLASMLPPMPPGGNKFGLAHAQNETIEQVELFTGLGKTSGRFAEVISFNGKTELAAWRGKCSTINGTNGELYKPFVTAGEPIKVFIGPLCRSFWLEPMLENETGEHKTALTPAGVRVLWFEFTPQLYLGVRSNPSNRCYCADVRTFDCQYDGLIAMGPCFFGAPLYFSRANLAGVDKRISSTTRFLETVSARLPETQGFALEPTTGTVLLANITLTGMFKVVRQPYMRDLARVQNLTYAPVFTTNESVEVPFDIAWQMLLLQRVLDYHGPAMVATAASGALALIAKRFVFS